MRASTVPLLEDEPLVIVRASFLALCDGNHCAAALLNNFVYWHDWCVTHGRYDSVAGAADPEHHASDPERWFWKSTETLVNDDLLGLWGEKKVRAAIETLEAKGYAQSRFNPKNPCDRTKQYRLVSDRLAADLQRGAPAQGRGDSGSAETPAASGKTAECTQSMTCGESPIRPNGGMQSAARRNLQTETTNPEITTGVYPSSSSPSVSERSRAGKTDEEVKPKWPRPANATHYEKAIELDDTARMIQEWAAERHLRRRRDDRSYGGPDDHWAAQWGMYCLERAITGRQEIFEVMDTAKAVADRREQWRFWKYLDEQVQHAAERYAPRDVGVAATSLAHVPEPVEDPSSEWCHVKRQLAQQLHPVAYANWIEHTYQIGLTGAKLRVWVADEVTRDWLENEYAVKVRDAVLGVGCGGVEYTTSQDTA